MNTKLKTNKEIREAFQELLTFKNKEEKLSHETRMIMYRFLSEIEKACEEKNINKKSIAELINTSASYVTQLFRGDKILNLHTIAKLQDAFDLTFQIKAIPNNVNYLRDFNDNCETFIVNNPNGIEDYEKWIVYLNSHDNKVIPKNPMPEKEKSA
jgi:transcriptional regulator with XRE-family HTH domain